MKEVIKQEAGVCPKCGEAELDYWDEKGDYDDSILYYYTCGRCGLEGQELHSVKFVEHLDSQGIIYKRKEGGKCV